MKKILALALTLVMVVGLLPVIGTAVDEVALDMASATLSTSTSTPNYYIASKDNPAVKFTVSGDVATLSGSMKKESVNLASLVYRDIITNKTNEDVHVTQTINITTMPVFADPGDNGGISAHGYYNLLSRQYGSATAPLSSSVANSGYQDRIMYSIYNKDGNGNLGLRVFYYYYNAETGSTSWRKKDVPNFAEKVGTAFTLTTVWHADNKVTFVCDGESLVTYEDITFAYQRKSEYRDCLVIGYNANGTTDAPTTGNPVNMTVSNVKISHGHTAAADDGNCMTAIKCSSCGVEMTPAQTAHTPGADDGDCTTDIICSNTGCTQVATAGAANHTPGADDGDCTTDILCSVCGKVATAGAADHTPAADDGDCTTDILCSVCGKVATPGAANHTPEADDGDCTTAIKCSVCGKETTPAAQNHTPEADDGDCTTAIKCSVCGKVTTAAKEAHTGGTATCEKKAECANCGKEYGELAAHTPSDDGDCLTGFTCSVCGDPTPAIGTHTPAADDGDCTTAIKCTVCGKETTAAKAEHTPAEDDGDCTTAIKCTVCGKETTAAKAEHTPAEDDGDCTTAIKCTVCGKETTAAKAEHTPAEDDGDCTTAIKCTVCGKVTTAAKEAHTEKVVNAKPATETEKGYTGDKVCSVCGKELAKGEEIPVLEPAPTEPAPTEPAPTTPPTTEPSTPDAPVVNPDTGDNGTAVYALLLAVSMMAMVVLMVPDIRNKLIRK